VGSTYQIEGSQAIGRRKKGLGDAAYSALTYLRERRQDTCGTSLGLGDGVCSGPDIFSSGRFQIAVLVDNCYL
jgi:hypothetical protein